jgi:hypothetical protein
MAISFSCFEKKAEVSTLRVHFFYWQSPHDHAYPYNSLDRSFMISMDVQAVIRVACSKYIPRGTVYDVKNHAHHYERDEIVIQLRVLTEKQARG